MSKTRPTYKERRAIDKNNLILVGYQIRYHGSHYWDFVKEHPGPLPQCHVDRLIRPVYADRGNVERQSG